MATTTQVFDIIYNVQSRKNLDDLDAVLEDLEGQHKKLGDASDVASAKTMNLGRTMMEAGRFAQDFAQGGIGGILNNIEGLVSALGLGAGAAGLFTAVGVGAVFVLPKLLDLGRSFFDVKTVIPPLTDEVKRLTEAQNVNEKAIDALRNKGSLYADDLMQLNKLTAESRQLEMDLAEARARAADVKKMEALRVPGVPEEEKAREKMLTGRLAGEQAQIEAGLAQVESADEEKRLIEERDKKRKEMEEGLKLEEKTELAMGTWTFAGQAMRAELGRLKAPVKVDDEAIQRRMSETLAGAFAGKAGPFARVHEIMVAHPEMFTSKARAAFEEATPEALARRTTEANNLAIDRNMAKEADAFRDREKRSALAIQREKEERFRSFRDMEQIMDEQERQDLEDRLHEADKEFRGAERTSGLVPGSKESLSAQKIEQSNRLLEDIKKAIIDSAKKENPGLILRGPAYR